MPLVTAKLHRPLVRSDVVPRPRLSRRLDDACHQGLKLTLVSAPAGFGKTTLVSAWAGRYRGPVAWLTLDEGDSDVTRFLTYLLAALRTTGAVEALDVDLEGLPPSQVREILSAVINVVSRSAVCQDTPDRIVLILDDYQAITAAAVHEAVALLLEYLPACMHLVIVTRTEPPLPLGRLRARGHLCELRMAELRFQSDEAWAFLSETMGLRQLTRADAQTLEERTEGWIAALQLAGLSMQGRTDVRTFVQAFAGSHRYVLDYLADEVFSIQPQAIQDFLLRTAILDRLCGGLCDALTGQREGHLVLEHLERQNLFVVALDQERTWYRYHHLFAELLRYRLERTYPDLVRELHYRASIWYENHDRPYEAIGHALAARDFDRAAALVQTTDPATLAMRGEVTTLLRWLDALPLTVLRSNPRLSISYAWALFVKTDLDAIEAHLVDALNALGLSKEPEDQALSQLTAERQVWLGEIAALRALVAVNRGEAQRAIALAERALDALPADDRLVRSAVLAALGDAYQDTDRLRAAGRAYEQAAASLQALGIMNASMTATSDLARLHVVQGQLRRAADEFQRVLAWGAGRHVPLYPVGQAYVGLADILREWNTLEEAEDTAARGIEQCAEGGYQRYLLIGLVSLARISLARGHHEQSASVLERARRLAQQLAWPGLLRWLAAHQARLALAAGDLNAAQAWARAHSSDAPNRTTGLPELELLTMARIELALTAAGGARASLQALSDRLDDLAGRAARAERGQSVLEINLLLGLTAQAQGQPAKALAHIASALALAAPEGYTRLFLDEGPLMQRLLRQAVAQGIEPDASARLLSALEFDAAAAARPAVDALTERELEVLRLLASGLSYAAIADGLHLGVSTVKTHINRAYDKLGVSNRTLAVARARELGLM